MSAKKAIPSKARAVVIGGGVAGCSVAYHLTKQGWKDVVLLERKQLTCGTTWHAAGLIAQLRATKNMTRLAKYSQELYGELEAETGVATGFRRCCSITVALTEERKQEIFRQASMARAFGVQVEEITPEEVKARYEHLNTDGVVAGVGSVVVFLPQILILFLFIIFLEDSGYMARAAFLMDRVMRACGLSG